MLLKEHQQIHKQPDLICYMRNYANKKSGVVAKTQIELLPDITIQV